jgi:hypothetical protein
VGSFSQLHDRGQLGDGRELVDVEQMLRREETSADELRERD